MHRCRSWLLIVAIVLLGLRQGQALEMPETSYGVGGSGSYLLFDDASASDEGIDDQGFGVGARLDMSWRECFVLSLGVGLVWVSDEDPFEQTVIEEQPFRDSEIKDMESDIEGYSILLEGGYRYRLGPDRRIHVGCSGGYHFLELERTISRCYDCRSDSVDIDGGGYGALSLGYSFPGVMVETSYSAFLGNSDVEGMLLISVTALLGGPHRSGD